MDLPEKTLLEQAKEDLAKGQKIFRASRVQELVAYFEERLESFKSQEECLELVHVSEVVNLRHSLKQEKAKTKLEDAKENDKLCCDRCLHREDHFYDGTTRYAYCVWCKKPASACNISKWRPEYVADRPKESRERPRASKAVSSSLTRHYPSPGRYAKG